MNISTASYFIKKGGKILNQISNPCIRCGKQRIVVKTWTEETSYSQITHTEMSCPDPECQKLVDNLLAVQKEKKEATMAKRKHH